MGLSSISRHSYRFDRCRHFYDGWKAWRNDGDVMVAQIDPRTFTSEKMLIEELAYNLFVRMDVPGATNFEIGLKRKMNLEKQLTNSMKN